MATDRNPLSWTSALVLTDVRRKASLPVTSTDWTDAVILSEATDVLWDFADWAMAQSGEGRMLASLERPVSANLTGPFSSGNEALLPPLALAGTVESVTWTNATGQNEFRLSRIDGADQATFTAPTEDGDPNTYALIGDRLRLFPRPSSGGTLRITYQRRHPQLVVDTVANVGTISAIAQATATTSTVTHTLTGLAVGDTVDILSASYPYSPLVTSVEVTALPGTLAVPYAQLSGFDSGARIVRAGQSPYVSLPLEFRTAVTEKTAANILRSMGDLQGMQAAEANATMSLGRVMQMLNPRVKRDKPRAINPWSHLRTRTRSLWRW